MLNNDKISLYEHIQFANFFRRKKNAMTSLVYNSPTSVEFDIQFPLQVSKIQ